MQPNCFTTVDTDMITLKLLDINDLYQICFINKYIYNWH